MAKMENTKKKYFCLKCRKMKVSRLFSPTCNFCDGKMYAINYDKKNNVWKIGNHIYKESMLKK